MKNLLILLLLLLLSCTSLKKNNAKLENFKIKTSDIDNFWNAYDKLKDTKDSVKTLQSAFFDKASPEFKKFIELSDLNAKDYINHIRYEPNFWKSIRPLTENIKTKKDNIKQLYINFSEIYPEFNPPNICFAISGLQAGGTTSNNLILIGSEIAAVNPEEVDVSEINGFLKNIFENSDGDILKMISHELIHTQQPSGDNLENPTLLKLAIIEGSADFIGSLIYGKNIMNKAIYEYGEKNEKELWKEFYNDMKKNKSVDETDWFYSYHSNRPADLGYYIGYKIVKSFYDNHKNKKQAIKEIIKMNAPKLFLKESGYIK